jgi:hypothetical protein
MKGLALALATLVTVVVPPQNDAAFLLAVLNRDGLAQPFAAFDGRRWKAPWPDHRQTELPISLDSVDRDWWGIGAPPSRMTLWAHGSAVAEASITALAQVRGLCSARLGLRTDFKPKTLAPPRMKQPYPKDGLLVSGSAQVGRIEMVQQGSEEWNRALILLTDDFNNGESRAIASFDGWRHPVREESRRRQPVTIEAIYKAPSDAPGWTSYFVEAVREYTPSSLRPSVSLGSARKDDCGPTTTGQAWVHVGPGNKSEVDLTSRVTYCDRKGVNVMLPFGTIRAGKRTYWVYQFSGYEDEWYQVVRPEPKDIDVAVSFHAGSCPE